MVQLLAERDIGCCDGRKVYVTYQQRLYADVDMTVVSARSGHSAKVAIDRNECVRGSIERRRVSS